MKWHSAWLLVVTLMVGCSTNSIGTEVAAKSFFLTEFQKRIAGESSAVATKQPQGLLFAPPISFDIRSVAPSEPDFLASRNMKEIPTDWQTWPAYKLNVAIEWKSEDGSAKVSGAAVRHSSASVQVAAPSAPFVYPKETSPNGHFVEVR